jgi:hypothetical protein
MMPYRIGQLVVFKPENRKKIILKKLWIKSPRDISARNTARLTPILLKRKMQLPGDFYFLPIDR